MSGKYKPEALPLDSSCALSDDIECLDKRIGRNWGGNYDLFQVNV
jgi:hypothetical protein